VSLFLSSLGGSIIGITAMLLKGVGRKYALPFAPFLCLGALLYLFFGRQLIDFYISPH
jgi:leader peptidase (prepilin peptidase)/N-methyltransferase